MSARFEDVPVRKAILRENCEACGSNDKGQGNPDECNLEAVANRIASIARFSDGLIEER